MTSDQGCSNCSRIPGGWVYVPVCTACGNVEWCADEVHPGVSTTGRVRSLRRRHVSLGWDSLTDSEVQIAGLVAVGMTNRQIAARVFSSPYTVDSHLRHIFRKLGISSRVELTRVVVEHHAARGSSPACTHS